MNKSTKTLLLMAATIAGIGFLTAFVLGVRFFIKYDQEQTIKTTDQQKEGIADF